MFPLAAAATEYGALASRGSFSRLTSDLAEALSSPDFETAVWVAAAVAIVVLALRRNGRLAFVLLLCCGAAFAAKLFDLW